jgi:predicted nucleic acid-binding protein
VRILQGLKNRKEGKTLGELFSIIPYVEVKREDWEKAGDLLRNDALIAIVAKQHGYSVLTLDRHFEHLEVSLHLSRN